MTSDNFDKALRLLQDRRPYQVFTVELNTGKQIEVDHPNALVVRDGVAVYVAPGGIPVLFDHDSVSQIIGSLANNS